MDHEKIKNITDYRSLSDLYNSLFMQKDVFIKTDGINVKVKFIKFIDGKIYLHIPVDNYEFKRSAIYTRNTEKIIYSHIIPYMVEGDIYIFETEGSQIFYAPRNEKRIQTEGIPGKKTVVSQIISNFVIKESIMQNRARIDWIRNEITSKVSSAYSHVEVFFLGDRHTDTRMSWIMDDREPVFIPDIRCSDTDDCYMYTTSYTRDIYYHDKFMQENNLISEITVPLLFRMMMPFGYIKINHSNPLTEENFFKIKRLGMAHSESLSKDMQLFKPSIDTISVSDLSLHGMGMIFREKSLIKHFREEALVIFTAYMPDNTHAILLCRVMNISLIDNIYRIGCIIESIDADGEMNYRKFIEEK